MNSEIKQQLLVGRHEIHWRRFVSMMTDGGWKLVDRGDSVFFSANVGAVRYYPSGKLSRLGLGNRQTRTWQEFYLDGVTPPPF